LFKTRLDAAGRTRAPREAVEMIGHAGTRHHRSTLGENQRPQSLPALDSDDVR
jgi:hypothetical protein